MAQKLFLLLAVFVLASGNDHFSAGIDDITSQEISKKTMGPNPTTKARRKVHFDDSVVQTLPKIDDLRPLTLAEAITIVRKATSHATECDYMFQFGMKIETFIQIHFHPQIRQYLVSYLLVQSYILDRADRQIYSNFKRRFLYDQILYVDKCRNELLNKLKELPSKPSFFKKELADAQKIQQLVKDVKTQAAVEMCHSLYKGFEPSFAEQLRQANDDESKFQIIMSVSYKLLFPVEVKAITKKLKLFDAISTIRACRKILFEYSQTQSTPSDPIAEQQKAALSILFGKRALDSPEATEGNKRLKTGSGPSSGVASSFREQHAEPDDELVNAYAYSQKDKDAFIDNAVEPTSFDQAPQQTAIPLPTGNAEDTGTFPSQAATFEPKETLFPDFESFNGANDADEQLLNLLDSLNSESGRYNSDLDLLPLSDFADWDQN